MTNTPKLPQPFGKPPTEGPLELEVPIGKATLKITVPEDEVLPFLAGAGLAALLLSWAGKPAPKRRKRR
jgi:hypothetical protein